MTSVQLGAGVDPAPHALHAAPPPSILKPVKVRIHPTSASVSIDVAEQRPQVAVPGDGHDGANVGKHSDGGGAKSTLTQSVLNGAQGTSSDATSGTSDEPRLVSGPGGSHGQHAPRHTSTGSSDDPSKPLLAADTPEHVHTATAPPGGDGGSTGHRSHRSRSLDPTSHEYGAGAFKPTHGGTGMVQAQRRGSEPGTVGVHM